MNQSPTAKPVLTHEQLQELSAAIKAEAQRLGFAELGICDTDLGPHVERYQAWLEQNLHGELDYMSRHGSKRWVPEELVPETLRSISVRMNYVDEGDEPMAVLANAELGYISRYALGRDYHKVIRSRLKKLIAFIEERARHYNFRAFVDSAPVLERALAQKAGLGWFGKNTMLINHHAGSWFFLGEIYTNLPLPTDPSYTRQHCGGCTKCLDLCPTNAFKGPYILDAKRCISYLTIEHKGSIPLELRSLMGNRIYGCDDCQLVCPWTKKQSASQEQDFKPRHQLDNSELITLFEWDEATFLAKTEGSPIRRTGYENWLRNIAVALGNAPSSPNIIAALKARQAHASALVQEHVCWALAQHGEM